MKPANVFAGVNLSGKTALVTGGTGGIGKELVRGLARLGATVVIGARNAQKGEAVREELARDTGNSNLSLLAIDVADLKSVRAAAVAFGERPLHILVNNAGAWFSDRRESPDGHELTLATDVLGPHLLTSLLLPRLRASAPARIINIVSSVSGNLEADDLQFSRRKYDGFKAYAQAKQALRMLTWGLAARLADSKVTVNTAAPGFVRTDFNQNVHGFVPAMIKIMGKLFAVTPDKGADTPLWAAVAPELEGVSGKYLDARKEKDGKFRDPAAIADLERRCDDLVSERSSVRAA